MAPARGGTARQEKRRFEAPTPLLRSDEHQAVEIRPALQTRRFAGLRIVLRLVGFGVWLAYTRVTRRADPSIRARRTRDLLEDLGGLWIKAGQIASLRTDVLSPEMADQLAQLAHRAHGFEPSEARAVVEHALGCPIADVFSSFDDHPFAAASISQVHRAQLRKNGAQVAVKVQRPGIQEVFERDLRLIKRVVRLARRAPGAGHIDVDAILREIRRIMTEEIDYRFEVSNLRRARKNLKAHGVLVPKVYRRLSGANVIVMDFVDGVLMSDYLRVLKSDPERVERWRTANDVVGPKVGERLMRSFYRQLFEDNLFHGDLQPGNIVLLRNSRFALIDLGSMGSVEPKMIEYYRMMSQAFSVSDYSKALDYYLLMAESVPVMDTARFKAESVEMYREWEARTKLDGLTYYERSITGSVGTQMAQLAQRYKVSPSNQFLRVARSLATLDANLGVLLGGSDPRKIMRRYFKSYRKREIRRARDAAPRAIISGLAEMRMTATFAAERVRQGSIRVHGLHRKVDQVVRSTLGIVRFAMIVLLAVVGYDFLHLHHAGFLDWTGGAESLDRLARAIVPIPYEWYLVLIVFLLYVLRQMGKIRRRYGEGGVPLPDGRTSGS